MRARAVEDLPRLLALLLLLVLLTTHIGEELQGRRRRCQRGAQARVGGGGFGFPVVEGKLHAAIRSTSSRAAAANTTSRSGRGRSGCHLSGGSAFRPTPPTAAVLGSGGLARDVLGEALLPLCARLCEGARARARTYQVRLACLLANPGWLSVSWGGDAGGEQLALSFSLLIELPTQRAAN